MSKNPVILCKFIAINPLHIFCHTVGEKQIIELLKGFTVSATLCMLNACKLDILRKRYLSEEGLTGTVGSKLLVLVSELVSFSLSIVF
jgi:hypothetical protein